MIKNHRGYYIRATRETAYPPSWRWRIMRRGKPMGVQIEGGGFATYDAAWPGWRWRISLSRLSLRSLGLSELKTRRLIFAH